MRKPSGTRKSNFIIADLNNYIVVRLQSRKLRAVDNQRLQKPEASNKVVIVTFTININHSRFKIVNGVISLAARDCGIEIIIFDSVFSVAAVNPRFIGGNQFIFRLFVFNVQITMTVVNGIVARAADD